MSFKGIFMHSCQSGAVFRHTFETSIVKHFAPLVESTWFQWSLIVSMSAVSVVTMPGQSVVKLPQTAICVLLGSSFSGRMVQTILGKVTVLPLGTWCLWMKKMALVPFVDLLALHALSDHRAHAPAIKPFCWPCGRSQPSQFQLENLLRSLPTFQLHLTTLAH